MLGRIQYSCIGSGGLDFQILSISLALLFSPVFQVTFWNLSVKLAKQPCSRAEVDRDVTVRNHVRIGLRARGCIRLRWFHSIHLHQRLERISWWGDAGYVFDSCGRAWYCPAFS